MKKSIFLVTCVLSLILAACGGSDDGGGGNPAATPKQVVNPWAGIDSEALDEDVVTDRIRVLEFSDDSSISYDGSDEGGAEEVCRRERREDENQVVTFYEVCMPLEDDPYFVVLPNNAFVWHPLMFERFGTELSCYEYVEGTARGAAGDCADIFSSIAGEEGEDFDCQAGLVNGDKALKCSDDWAVVVNGAENDSKTVCRVHLSDNSGRCLGAPKHGVADASLILPMQKSSWDGYRSNQDNNQQFGTGDAGVVQTPQDLPAGAKLSYASADEAICSVDNDASDGGLGTVMIAQGVSAPSECRIVLTIEAEGFADRIIFADLEILKENDASWADYVRANNYFYPGENLPAEAVTSNDPASTQNVYESLDESICTVDEDSGEATAVAAGECMVRLTATAAGYLDKIIEKIIPVDGLKQVQAEHADWAISWSDFPTSAIVGVDSDALAPPVLQQPDVDNEGMFVAVADSGFTLEIVHVSGDCSYNTNNTKISFTDATECVLEVTASGKRGYAEFSEQFSVPAGNGSFALTWGGYGSGANAATFGSAAPDLDAPTTDLPDSDADFSYSAEGGGCSVDADSGALTIVGADVADKVSCTVTLTATRSGYDQESAAHPITIGKAAAGAAIGTDGNAYGGIASLIAGDGSKTVAIVNAPTVEEGSVEYSSEDAAVCTVAEDGTVTLLAAGTCVINAGLAATDNAEASATHEVLNIEVLTGTEPVAGDWGTDPYGASPEVEVGASLAITGTAPTGDGDIHYRSADENICTVAADGAVSGVSVGPCEVSFRDSGDSSNAATPWSDALAINVIQGTIPDLSGDNVYGSSAVAAIGGTLELEEDLSRYGTATFSVTSGDNCTVDENTGAVTPTEDAADSDTCTIQATFAGNDDYAAQETAADLATITVGPGSQIITFSDPYGAGPSLGVDGTLALVNAPSADQGGAISYREKDVSICSVAADGTVTGVMPGECVVQARAAAVTNYNASEWVDIAAIEVGEGMLDSLTWNVSVSGRLGAELVLPAVNVGSTGAAVVYSIKDAGDTGCAFKGTSGADARTLVFASWGLCRVTATASKANYGDWVRDEYVRVRPGEITLGTMGAYANNAKIQVGGASLTPATNFSGFTPSDVTASWQLARGERDCELVDAAAGKIRALQVAIEDATNPPVCSLQVVAGKHGHENFKSEIVSVPLQRGTIAGATVKYGHGINAILPVGGNVDIASVSGADGLSVAISDIAVQGVRSGANAEGICEVDNDATSPNYGRVSAVLAPPPAEEEEEEEQPAEDDGQGQQQENADAAAMAAVKGDVCKVTITVSAVGYEDKVLDAIDLAVSGDLTVPADAALAYAASLKIGDSAALEVDSTSNLPADDGDQNSPISITWKYLAEGKDGKDGVCSVDEADGSLSLGDGADAGDVCLVSAVATASGYTDVILAPIEVMVAAGDLVLTNANRPDYPADLNLGGSLLPDNVDAQDDNSVPISWGAWRVVGKDGNDAEKTGVCSIDAEGVVSAGEAAAKGDICEVYALASAENYQSSAEEKVDSLTIDVKADFASVTGPDYGDTALTLRGYPVAVNRAPAVSGGVEVDWSYEAVGKRDENGSPVEVEDVCSVDAAGTVTPGSAAQAGDTCEIVATASAAGYNDGVAEAVELTLKDTLNSLTWAGFPTEATVGVPLNLASNQPVADPSDATVAITVSGACEYSNSDVLTFSDATECVVTATASKSGYADFSRSYSITPSAGSLTPTWGSYASVTVSTTPVNAPTITGVSGGTTVYSEGSGSVGCTVAANGAVTGTAVGTCLVDVVLSKTGYADADHQYSISVGKGTQDDPATNGNPYGTTPTLAVGASPKGISNALAAGQGALVYNVHSGDTANCQVDSGTGAVTAKAAGADNDCRIQAKYAGNANYLESGVSTIATIGIEKGDFTGVAWTGYASSPVLFSDTPPTVNTPSSTPTTTTWTYTSTTTSVCTVNSGTGALTFVSVGTCTVEAYPTATGYNNGATQSASVVINKGTQTASTWSTNPYTGGGNLVVGGSAKGVNNNLKPTTGHGNIEYRVFADHSTHCSVGGTSGVLRAKVAGAENDCKVEYRFIGDSNYQASPWGTVGTVSIDKGTLTGSWGSYPALVVGSTVSAPAITATSTNGSAVTVTPTYSAGTNTSDCTITAATGAVRGDSVGNSCQVDVTISATGYNNATHTYTISVGAGSISGLSWSPSQSTGTVGVSLTLDAMTTSTQGDIITYTRVSGNCSFADNTVPTLTFTGVANCVVTASVARTGYATWTSSSHSITVGKGANTGATTAVDAYAGLVKVDRHISPNNSLPTGGEGGLEYRVHDSANPASSSASSVCTIRQSDGRVTGAGRAQGFEMLHPGPLEGQRQLRGFGLVQPPQQQ